MRSKAASANALRFSAAVVLLVAVVRVNAAVIYDESLDGDLNLNSLLLQDGNNTIRGSFFTDLDFTQLPIPPVILGDTDADIFSVVLPPDSRLTGVEFVLRSFVSMSPQVPTRFGVSAPDLRGALFSFDGFVGSLIQLPVPLAAGENLSFDYGDGILLPAPPNDRFRLVFSSAELTLTPTLNLVDVAFEYEWRISVARVIPEPLSLLLLACSTALLPRRRVAGDEAECVAHRI